MQLRAPNTHTCPFTSHQVVISATSTETRQRLNLPRSCKSRCFRPVNSFSGDLTTKLIRFLTQSPSSTCSVFQSQEWPIGLPRAPDGSLRCRRKYCKLE